MLAHLWKLSSSNDVKRTKKNFIRNVNVTLTFLLRLTAFDKSISLTGTRSIYTIAKLWSNASVYLYNTLRLEWFWIQCLVISVNKLEHDDFLHDLPRVSARRELYKLNGASITEFGLGEFLCVHRLARPFSPSTLRQMIKRRRGRSIQLSPFYQRHVRRQADY